ncbi:hypothetical protein J5N97_006188 [Dioscorea zingiberensis]|uniref:Uncharacterized protein n=1 Tax=Dioscorea zingiberensis TaxID=325984 RepID=A0A9D5DCM4_9LILI|nr:hypothetical protein J5N97_006188 [Dioscorea zingiberensis]
MFSSLLGCAQAHARPIASNVPADALYNEERTIVDIIKDPGSSGTRKNNRQKTYLSGGLARDEDSTRGPSGNSVGSPDCAAVDDDIAIFLEDENVVAFANVGVARPHGSVVGGVNDKVPVTLQSGIALAGKAAGVGRPHRVAIVIQD